MQLCSNAKQHTNHKLQVLQNDISTLRPKSEEENQRHIKVIHRQKNIMATNGGSNTQDKDMLNVNIVG